MLDKKIVKSGLERNKEMDVNEVQEFIEKQECIIYNLENLIRNLTHRKAGVFGTAKEAKMFKVVNNVLSNIKKTSCVEGPVDEKYITWNITEDLAELFFGMKSMMVCI